MKQAILFTANWCSACQTMKPIVEQVTKETNVQLVKIDTDYDVSLTQQYNIKSIPTLVILENGNEIKRAVGTQSADAIKNLIKG
jgi:thioredoxin